MMRRLGAYRGVLRFSTATLSACRKNGSSAASAASSPPNGEATTNAAGSAPGSAASPGSSSADSLTKRADYSPVHGIVEEYSQQALIREGRENQIEAVIWNEDSHYPPILARGQKSVYDYTDDIPKHVKPLYYYQIEQQRDYFKAKRDSRSLWQKLAVWASIAAGVSGFVGIIALTHIWFEQPKEIQQLRARVLVQSYGKVLELAAGTGMNIGSYPYAVSEIHMADSDATALQRIRYRIPKGGYPKYAVYQERAEYLSSFKDGEFDTVIDMFGLCHYRDPVMALRQMQRVCKPTGTILLLEHGRSRYPPVNWFLDYFSDRHNVNSHGCAWNRPILEYIKEARMVVKEKEDLHYGTTHYIVAYPELLSDAQAEAAAAVQSAAAAAVQGAAA